MSGSSSGSPELRGRLLGWYRIFCLVFGVFFVVYAGVRVGMLRAGHRELASRSFLTLRAGARTAMAAFDARDDTYFSTTLRELARITEDLELLAVHEKNSKVYYFFARTTSVFLTPPAPTADMTVVPAYRAPALTTLRMESVFEQTSTGRTITVEALYRILTPLDLHRVGKEAVYILLIFLFVTATVLLVAASLSSPGGSRDDVSPATAPPRAARPERVEPAPMPASRPVEPPVDPVPPPLARKAPAAEAAPERNVATLRREREAPRPAPAPTAAAAAAPAAEGLPRRASIYREDTGLVYRDYLESRLRSEIERAAASDQDVVLAIIAVDSTQTLAQIEAVTVAIAQRLRDTFPYRDLAFEYNQGFAVIIPDINLDKAILRLESFRAAVAAAPVEGQAVTVSVGVGARNGRLISDETLLREATQSLAKAIRDGRNQVVAFRADPDKFRRVLAT